MLASLSLERISMFQSVDDVIAGLGGQNYICNKNVATVVYLSTTLEKPILVEGPAGVGKTELGKVLAGALGMDLIRLQCYEGLDEAKALYEWEYAKQLLYTQILKDKIGEVLQGTRNLQDAVDCIAKQDGVFFSDRFLLPRPLLRALLSEQRSVLLIDEVDKSDAEFEAFLLEILSDFQITVPEIGTLKAKHVPLVVLTSNNSREMSDALKRRCLHLYLDFPDSQKELEIIKLKVPGVKDQLAQEVVQLLHRVRKLDLKKTPSISETLDWVKALTLLNVKQLDHDLVQQTLSALMKYEADIRKAHQELKAYLAERKVQQTLTGSSGSDKDHLH
jgi:MoxR-like ATPase